MRVLHKCLLFLNRLNCYTQCKSTLLTFTYHKIACYRQRKSTILTFTDSRLLSASARCDASNPY